MVGLLFDKITENDGLVRGIYNDLTDYNNTMSSEYKANIILVDSAMDYPPPVSGQYYEWHIDLTTKVQSFIAKSIYSTLSDAQNAKIQQIKDLYNQALEAGFTSSATGTSLTYDYSPSSQTLWKELKDMIGNAVDGGILPDSVLFPGVGGTMNITIANKTLAPHTRGQLTQVIKDIAIWKLQMYTKYQNLVNASGTIMSATSVNAVNNINW